MLDSQQTLSDDLVVMPNHQQGPRINEDDIPADAKSQNVICVFNLPQTTQDDSLQEFFGTFGKIVKIYTIREKYKGTGPPPAMASKCKGYAFIYYADPVSAQCAREQANDTEFEGRSIRVDLSFTAKKERVEAPESDILCVFGLPPDITVEEVQQAFEARSPDVARVNLVKEKSTGRYKGFGFVYFRTPEAAVHAKEACEDLVIKGHMVRVDFSLTREPREAPEPKKPSPSTSFPRGARPCNVLGCFGLPHSTIEQDVKNLFSPYGQVFKADIVMDKQTGRCKGYGFVYFTKTDDATKAYQAISDGSLSPTIKGQTIRVDYSLTTAPPQTRSTADPMVDDDKKKKRQGSQNGMSRKVGGKPDDQVPIGSVSQIGGYAQGQVLHQQPLMQQPMMSQEPQQPPVLKLEGIPEDFLACFPLPTQQELDKGAGYARGYDDCRVSMLRTLDSLIKSGRLLWSANTTLPMGLGMVNAPSLNRGMMLGSMQQPDMNAVASMQSQQQQAEFVCRYFC